MSLLCQRNCYLKKQESARVVACEPAGDEWDVVLDDTILFPEGGGQPPDHGEINNVPVKDVQKGEDGVVRHRVAQKVDVNSAVTVSVDWDRRFDHMQQHSGQHLITAIADRDFGWKTTGWHLGRAGEGTTYVELDNGKLTLEQLRPLEASVNAAILEDLPVALSWHGRDDVDGVRARSDVETAPGEDVVRVVSIGKLDRNMCCGTHVSSLKHLQCVSFLTTERVKKNTRVFFAVGLRVVRLLASAMDVQRATKSVLHTAPSEFAERCEALVKSTGRSAKHIKGLLREMAEGVAAGLGATTTHGECGAHHRDDGDVEYLSAIVTHLDALPALSDTAGFLLTADGGGAVLFYSRSTALVAAATTVVKEVLQAKGGVRGTRFQGKALLLSEAARMEALARLRDLSIGEGSG